MNTLQRSSILASIVAGLCTLPGPAFSQPAGAPLRIGVFDSRCVAIAHGRSASFAEHLKNLRADLAKAKESGNEKRVKEIEQIGPTSQVLMHQQGFSTGSVRNIMQTVAGQLPAIAGRAHVSIIVSQWELFFQDGQAELVDVTDEVVALFKPDEQTRTILEQVKKADPVPIEQISLDPRQ